MSRRRPRKTLRFTDEELKISGQGQKSIGQGAPEQVNRASAQGTKMPARDKKISGLEQKSEKIGQKLDKARAKQPTRTVVKKERVFSDKRQKPQTKLVFEEKAVPINEAKWNRPKKRSVPRKTAGTVKTAGVNKLHSKVYEAEHENVGVQAAHKGELVGESAYRGGKKATHSAYRFVRNTPYRKASKLETASVKNEMKLTYQKALRDNPKLKSNPISRFMQKRSIKKDYAQALRTAKKTGQTAKKTGSAIQKTTQAVTKLVRRNPVALLHAGLLLLIIMLLISMLSMCGTLFSGGSSFIGATSYAAEDWDINQAELSYTQWETDLQVQVQNAESTYNGYDEYRYNIGDIGHDPYALMAYLTAVYEDFTYAEIEGVLQGLFNQQYQLAFTPSTEIRYRTETRTETTTDPVTGETTTTSYDVEVPYEWHILNVTLTSTPLNDILIPLMNSDQTQHYQILMQSKGNRQYVGNPFDFNWLPYVSSYYGYRISPISGAVEFHTGVDIAVPQGTQIRAGFDGTVISAGYDGGYGNCVVIENKDGVQARYAHCDTLNVTAGQTIKEGDVIATVGSTGDSTGPHLHLEVIKDGQQINPLYFAVTGDFGNGSVPPGNPGGPVIPPDPGSPMGDGSYAALIAEAERYLGYPYVWGGSSPSTSFDCSGFVCWVLNHSGVANVGRTTAQGLFNLCTPVSLANAQPGDLIFFSGTYSTASAVTHVGIYVGNGMMLHCGNPIQYTSINTNYWQNHFYSFGRISG